MKHKHKQKQNKMAHVAGCLGMFMLKLMLLMFITTMCPAHTVFDIEELSVQYGIEISNKPVVLDSYSEDQNVLQLSSKHGQIYSCFLPPPVMAQDDEKEAINVGGETVVDILDKSFNGTCLTHKKGWWTYKLCHKKKITQYHVSEGGEVSGAITILGEYLSEDDWTKNEVKDRKPSELFHTHHYKNGQTCDVTQKEREATVQYFCDAKSKDDIIRIEEPATCDYIITVSSMKLCSHPLFFKKEKKKQVNLVCSPALLQHEFNKYTAKMNKKKAAAADKVMEAKKRLDEEQKASDSSSIDESGETGKVGEKLKDTMNSFMKGFMNALNIKGDTENMKFPSTVLKGDAIDNILGQDDIDPELNDYMKAEEDKVHTEMDEVMKARKEKSKKLEKAMGELNKDTVQEQKSNKISVDNEIDASKKSNAGNTVKDINDLTSTMIKQLERDSKNMQNKAAEERKAMHIEFERVRKESMKELKRAKSLLDVLNAVKQSTTVASSKERVEKQLKYVTDLVTSLEEQIKLIDLKRKSVDELEEDTNKRLYDINKKILNTKTAHNMAKQLVSVATGIGEDRHDKKTNKIREIKNAKMKVETDFGEERDDSKGTSGTKNDDNSQVKGNYEDFSEKLSNDLPESENAEKNKPTSQLVSKMLSSLKEQVFELNKDLKSKKIGEETITESGDEATEETEEKSKSESSLSKENDLDSLVDVLKKEMLALNKKLKKGKDKNTDANDKELVDETEKDMKDNMEVRIRTLDEKAFDTEFDDDNVDKEVKEATKKMEEDVRKQLKEAGLNFNDNIKIKIITTKDKFDQFSKGKGVKLLSEDDAADFKDLLLGFLGGGKEKAREEERLHTLEKNYNFVYDDDEDDVDGSGLLQ